MASAHAAKRPRKHGSELQDFCRKSEIKNPKEATPITAVAMNPVTTQAPVTLNRPITFWLVAIFMMSTITGAATKALSAAAQISALTGLILKDIGRRADESRHGDGAIKGLGLGGLLRHCDGPLSRFAQGIRGGPSEHRNRQQACSDDSERKKRECEIPSNRLESFRGLRGAREFVDAVNMQRSRGSRHDGDRDQVRYSHADQGVETDARQRIRPLVGTAKQGFAEGFGLGVLDLL